MFWNKRRIYLDYASATPVSHTAAREVMRANEMFGNPGSIHADGVAAKKLLESSRERIARSLACKARELVFVSGGTEANNLAIVGHARKLLTSRFDLEPQGRTLTADLTGTHWAVSSIEHPSVLSCFGEVERLGGSVSYIEPDKRGLIRSEALSAALKPETVFVSIGWANHEIGVIQPLSDLARTIHAFEEKNSTTILFHSDAGQAPLYRAPHVHTRGVDLFSIYSGKLHGPRGIGVLYLSNRVALAPIILGGSQERGLRAGTEDVSLAAGFAAALEDVDRERASENARIEPLRNALAKQLEKISGVIINGDLDYALPHLLNISIADVDTEYLTLMLDREGIAVATKSACREGEESESHVVAALVSAAKSTETWRASSTLRISLGKETTPRDISRASESIFKAISLLREKKMV